MKRSRKRKSADLEDRNPESRKKAKKDDADAKGDNDLEEDDNESDEQFATGPVTFTQLRSSLLTHFGPAYCPGV